MENGVNTVDEEHRAGATEMAEEDGALPPVPTGGDTGRSHKQEDGEDNDVFEEALDNESFHALHHHPASGSRDFVFNDGETSEAEKFGESTDALVDHKSPNHGVMVEPEASDDAAEAEGSDLDPAEEPRDAPVHAKSSEEEAAGSEEKAETVGELDLAIEEAAEVEADGAIGEGAGDAEGGSYVLEDGVERVTEYNEKEFVGEKSINGEFNGVNSKGVHRIVNEKAENGASHDDKFEEQISYEEGVRKEQYISASFDVLSNSSHLSEYLSESSDKELVEEKSGNGELNRVNLDGPHFTVSEKAENGESHDAELKEHVPYEEVVPKKQDVSVGLDVPSNNTLQSQDHSANGSSNSHATRGIKGPLIQGEGEIPRAASKPQARELLENESVLVEDLSESSSTDDDDNRIHSQPAPSATSRPTYLGAPPLPSRPPELGSSAPLLEPAGATALSSRPAGLGSCAPLLEPAGATAMPSLPAGLGSSAPLLEPAGATAMPSRPAGLGSSAPLLEPAHRTFQQSRANGSVPQRQSHPSEELANDDAEEDDETRQKLQMIRVKFLRLAHRLGQTPHNVVVAQVLYRLGLAEQLRRNTNRPGVFSFDRASVMAEQLETAGQEPLDFSCTIMVIGKTGVGKSATINAIFDEAKFHTDAFQSSTKKVQDIVGKVQGITVRVIDTPGLSSSSSDQRHNEKILRSVKRFISKTPPDIVLYFDRLDMQSRDNGDITLLSTITEIFGTSIWFNAIVVLTHAASAPPEGPNGTPMSYELFVTQRSHVVQQAIHRATGDMRLMNPVSLVENHSACRMNRAGQRVLPNGQVWKPQLLLLSFASKILAEANMLLKLQDSPPGKPSRAPPLPFLLSSLLQSRPQLRLPEEQFGDEDTMDEDLDEASDSDDGSDFDELPPFKRLNKAQLDKLSKAQKKAYFEELEYREKLFFRKQLKEEKRRRKLMRKMAAAAKDLPNHYNDENLEDESSGPASVPVPMPDYVLPTSFDSDNPSHRYRFLDSSGQWLVRPVLDSQGWDHDVGYEGLNVERLFVVKEKIPMSVSGQLTKDKKECNLQMEVASSIKHCEGKSTSLGLDMQTVGKEMLYTLRGETRFKNFRRNDTAAGLSVTVLGDTLSAGMKVEDKLIVSKTLRLLLSGGAMTGRGDVAYGGRLEATLRDKDYPIGRMLSTLALSLVDWHGDLVLGCNIQSQIPLGRTTNLIGHVNLSNKGTGQVGVRLNSSEQLQIALLMLVPIFGNVKRMLFASSQPM